MLEALDERSAAQLFTERCAADAQAAVASEVAAIYAATEGLPLGIELAAGLTRTLPVERVAEELGSGLSAVLDWTYQLLGEQERKVLHEVAVFADGFTLEDAERIAADPRDVAPALTELADRNLLLVEDLDGRRFRVPGAVRDHTLQR